jgi:hypothetical protein
MIDWPYLMSSLVEMIVVLTIAVVEEKTIDFSEDCPQDYYYYSHHHLHYYSHKKAD